MTCDRCGNESIASTMSWFNLQTICMDCSDDEAHFPHYHEAKDAETAAVRQGDYRYPGIGLAPDDEAMMRQLIALRRTHPDDARHGHRARRAAYLARRAEHERAAYLAEQSEQSNDPSPPDDAGPLEGTGDDDPFAFDPA